MKNTFDDACGNTANFCGQFGLNTVCSPDENKCACQPGYYRSDGNIICGMFFENERQLNLCSLFP